MRLSVPCARRWQVGIVLLWLVAGCDAPSPDNVSQPVAEFAGSDRCASCHENEFAGWQGSDHQLAMQPASNQSVLGNFDGASFDYYTTHATFEKDGERYLVVIQDAQGQRQEYEVTYTFGVRPLQQYLVDLPGGRKQALPYLWDTRPENKGGQRWYHLYPDEHITPGNPLHWTGPYFNWNQMCAECHSSNVDVGYDLASDTFSTTYSEVSVGCEACHGPGSLHIEKHENKADGPGSGFPVDLKTTGLAAWLMNPETGIAERQGDTRAHPQTEACGRCHARRSVIAEDYEYGQPLNDTHMPALLEAGLYHADGRIREEVYVYGSFLQSKMYAKGVACTDCHNPHTAGLRNDLQPDELCSQCHLPARFAADSHYGDSGSGCVDCHMPATTYMGVDDRRDHSFRIPGAGDAATHYGQIIATARSQPANALLLEGLRNTDYPAIARATLLTLLQPPLSSEGQRLLADSLDDPEPLVRIGALRALRNLPANDLLSYGSHLLRDTVRGVRIEAVATYLEVRDLLPREDLAVFDEVADEYRAAMLASASLTESLTNLAEFESRLGNSDPAGQYLQYAIQRDPGSAVAQHAYGLFLVRSGQATAALEYFEKAAVGMPANSRYVYVYGIALNSLGLEKAALELMQQAHEDFPEQADIGWALATMLRDRGKVEAARTVAQKMHHHSRPGRDFVLLEQSLGRLQGSDSSTE
ncbi:cytochrome c3 family protein [Woeseia oceani]|uniref:Uncharacterized protein n=1 Tax=Woeseia oceani TaxID=1548547 RepID=A0A193LDL1_9GAMM|nr:cytochrome c3 family protein [Woeseia oceani]ANO50526.1 hypothetical protein BA177_04235 [Woeseia oceani]